MNKSFIGAVIVIFVAIAAGGIYVYSNSSDKSSDKDSSATNSSTSANGSVRPDSSNRQLTRGEVEEHDRKDDCWTIIDNKVYDVTDYIPSHPGGDHILETCGEDGTSLFKTRTDEDGHKHGSGKPHSTNAESRLNQYLVGPLNE